MALSPDTRLTGQRTAAASAATRRVVVAATILASTLGCDKARALADDAGAAAKGVTGRGHEAPAEPDPADRLDLSSRPPVLFEVFGEKEDPRMIPVAVVAGGRLAPIVLASSGWKQFDAMYHRSGTTYSLYRGGVRTGRVRVKQGMWEKEGAPLYSLPSCSRVTPLASVAIEGDAGAGFTIEQFASSAVLGGHAKPTVAVTARETQMVRDLAARVALAAGIPQSELDSLQFHAAALPTGVSTAPTLLASFIDPHAEDKVASNRTTAHAFVLADRDGAGVYQPTYSHIVRGAAATVEFRRFVDRLDVTGDGVDEIILEGWQYGGDTFLTVLGYAGGKWGEIYRGRASWCLDAKGGA